MLEHINDLLLRFENWGYAIVFLIVLLECQAFFGLFMPGESIVMLAGFAAGQEVFDVRALIAVVALAAIAGDTIGYEFGRLLGRDWLRRHGPSFWLRPARLDKMDAFFARHGGLSVLFAHFLHVGRALMPFLAGASRLPYPRFLVYNAIGCALWATIYTLVGYYFGQYWHLIERWIGRGSIVAGLFAGLIVGMIWLWRWVASRELEIQRWWDEWRARPRVVNVRERFAGHIDWLQQRFSPQGYLGIHLTIGIFLLLAAAAIFGGSSRGLGASNFFVGIDAQVARWFESHSAPAANRFLLWTAHLSSVIWLGAIALLAAAILLWRGEKFRLLLLLLAGPMGVALDFFLKQLFARERPGFGDELFARGSGVLNGDMLSATVIYGALAYILGRGVRRWRVRALLVLLTLFILFVIALSSLYLAAYSLSEVCGAMIEGAVWLLFCISGVEIVRWRGKTPRP